MRARNSSSDAAGMGPRGRKVSSLRLMWRVTSPVVTPSPCAVISGGAVESHALRLIERVLSSNVPSS